MAKSGKRKNHLYLKKEYYFLAAILLTSFGLNIYGIDWGLPSRWNVDQSVTTALNMLKSKTLLPPIHDLHPSLYYYILVLILTPYLLYQYIFYPNIDSLLTASNLSWNNLAVNYPDLATGIFMIARSSSVLFSVITVFLVYRIGKYIHGNLSGLFAALILALTMDFVNWAHMAKSISLVNLLILISMYYSFRIFNNEKFTKNYILFCLFGSLACSTKFNGGITFLFVPIVAAWPYLEEGISKVTFQKIYRYLKTMVFGIIIYISIFLLSSPVTLLYTKKYFKYSIENYGAGMFLPSGSESLFKIFFPNLLSLLGTLTYMFGIPLALVIGIGILYTLFQYGRQLRVVYIITIFIGLNIFLFAFAPRIFLSPDSKFITQTVPFLAILGGIFLNDFYTGKLFPTFKRKYKTVCLIVIFIISFFYCYSLDMLFVKDDLRYHSTRWILSNIPKKSNIILYSQLEYALGVEVLRNYNVYILDWWGGGGSRNYSFLNGEFHQINSNFNQQSLIRKNQDIIYFVSPCFQNRKGLQCKGSDRLPKGLKLIKSFERKSQWWYWMPKLGGYEPSRIEIFTN